MKSDKLSVAIVYRVVQSWRVPVFERLAEKYQLTVFYGCDFPGTKVVSKPRPHSFKSKKMFSIPIAIKREAGNMLLPLSPGIFFDLVRGNPDVVVCEGASNFLNNLFVFAYCKIFDKPMIQWGLGEIKGKKVSAIRKALNSIIQPIERRADAIISYSTYGGLYYRSLGISEDKIFVAVNVVDTDKRIQEVKSYLSTSECRNDNKFRILFVGALEPNKRVDILIAAFSELSQKHSNIELHIVGTGSSIGDLKHLCSDLGITSSVIFHGSISGALAPIACNMDVFVMPGLGGLAVSDMLCHGLPVFCGIGDGCEADLIDGTNGMIIEQLDEVKIVDVLDELIKSPELLDNMKVNAAKTIDKYNIHTYVNSISQAIDYCVKSI